MPKVYNGLENPELQFALLHRVRREYCERVVGGKKFKQDDVSLIAGDGRYGFQTRRQKREVASMVLTVDKTGLKKSRKTATRPRKEVCKLVNSFHIYWAELEPAERARRVREFKRAKRAKNRNRRAEYGRRKAVVFTTNNTTGRRGGLTPSPANH